jgi:hypothetical protein
VNCIEHPYQKCCSPQRHQNDMVTFSLFSSLFFVLRGCAFVSPNILVMINNGFKGEYMSSAVEGSSIPFQRLDALVYETSEVLHHSCVCFNLSHVIITRTNLLA